MRGIKKKTLSAALATLITVSSIFGSGAIPVWASEPDILCDECLREIVVEDSSYEEPVSGEDDSDSTLYEEDNPDDLVRKEDDSEKTDDGENDSDETVPQIGYGEKDITSNSSDEFNSEEGISISSTGVKESENTIKENVEEKVNIEDEIKTEELNKNKLSSGEVEAEDLAASDFDGFTKYSDDQKLYKRYIREENTGGYLRPSADTILADYKKSSSCNKHPRIMITKSYIDVLKSEVTDSGNPKALWYKRLTQYADDLYDGLKAGNKDYIFDYSKCYNSRMLTNKGITAADVFREDMMVLGMMYQITGNTKYADAAWVLLERMTNKDIFPDINPWHDLDFGFFCQGYAIAYDWMYSAWTSSRRTKLEEAIKRQCFRPANDSYVKNEKSSDQTSDNGIVGGMFTKHNHNAIVNAGVVMVSLALMDKYSYITSSLCHDAFICLELDLNTYSLSGLNTEGTEYMVLTMDNLAMMFSTMESALGKDKLYGLDKCPGLKDGRFIKAFYSLSSDVGQFSYSDTYDRLIASGGELYFDKHYGIHGFRKSIYDLICQNYPTDYTKNIQILCWYEPDKNESISISKDFTVGGDSALATFRSDFGSRQSFVGVKAGKTIRDFFVHLDQGSFVYNALGVKWASDLGKDSYGLPGYSGLDEKRLKIFRLRPDSHNTLLISPNSNDYGYELEKTATIKTSSSSNQAMAVVDMTNLVSSKATSYTRGFLLTDNRKSLVVRDEVKLKKQSKLCWVMYTEHPQSSIEINGNTAIITSKNKYDETVYLKMEFASSMEGKLRKESASPWSAAPSISGQNQNEDYTRIVFEISDAKDNVNITVKLTPQKKKNETDNTPKPSDYGAISKWDVNTAFSVGGWKKEGTEWYYYVGSEKQKGWIQSGGYWFYLDSSTGAMKIGWIEIGGNKYYLASSGVMKTGWFKDGNKWYFMSLTSGAMSKGWIKSGDYWFYMDPSSGVMKTGWLKSGNKSYYLNPVSGAMKTGWAEISGKWYYFKSDGSMAVNEWVDGGKYHVDSNGVWDK